MLPYTKHLTHPEDRRLPSSVDSAIPSWNPISLKEYLEGRERKIWRSKDTRLLLQRAEEMDALVQQLMRAAGVLINSQI